MVSAALSWVCEVPANAPSGGRRHMGCSMDAERERETSMGAPRTGPKNPVFDRKNDGSRLEVTCRGPLLDRSRFACVVGVLDQVCSLQRMRRPLRPPPVLVEPRPEPRWWRWSSSSRSSPRSPRPPRRSRSRSRSPSRSSPRSPRPPRRSRSRSPSRSSPRPPRRSPPRSPPRSPRPPLLVLLSRPPRRSRSPRPPPRSRSSGETLRLFPRRLRLRSRRPVGSLSPASESAAASFASAKTTTASADGAKTFTRNRPPRKARGKSSTNGANVSCRRTSPGASPMPKPPSSGWRGLRPGDVVAALVKTSALMPVFNARTAACAPSAVGGLRAARPQRRSKKAPAVPGTAASMSTAIATAMFSSSATAWCAAPISCTSGDTARKRSPALGLIGPASSTCLYAPPPNSISCA
mmetsp:Transcript_11641/g.36156  ORF Transcript_11641/g.36156 Transcript_11641/m.36156 type:complete len:408 (+) Transcript_11641:381-1604(+)